MRKVTEKPDFTNARTVKVWTKAGTGRFFEPGKSHFYSISWENDGESEFLDFMRGFLVK